MIGFDVGDVPNIGRVFAKRITRKFTFIWAFKVFFPGYLEGTLMGSRLKV